MCIVFIGVFVNLTVRKALVIDYNLPYPTGTAVGTMIRSFFNDGRSARRQALMLAKTGLAAFAWCGFPAPSAAPRCCAMQWVRTVHMCRAGMLWINWRCTHRRSCRRRDFWTWFFNGNCPETVATTVGYISSTVNQMCVSCSILRLAGALCQHSYIWAFLPELVQLCQSYAPLSRRPNLGPRAYTAGWHFDFTVAYIGAGFITPLSVRRRCTWRCGSQLVGFNLRISRRPMCNLWREHNSDSLTAQA